MNTEPAPLDFKEAVIASKAATPPVVWNYILQLEAELETARAELADLRAFIDTPTAIQSDGLQAAVELLTVQRDNATGNCKAAIDFACRVLLERYPSSAELERTSKHE